MLERLNVFLGGCGGKGAQDGDCIETLNQDRDALEKEGANIIIIIITSGGFCTSRYTSFLSWSRMAMSCYLTLSQQCACL